MRAATVLSTALLIQPSSLSKRGHALTQRTFLHIAAETQPLESWAAAVRHLTPTSRYRDLLVHCHQEEGGGEGWTRRMGGGWGGGQVNWRGGPLVPAGWSLGPSTQEPQNWATDLTPPLLQLRPNAAPSLRLEDAVLIVDYQTLSPPCRTLY